MGESPKCNYQLISLSTSELISAINGGVMIAHVVVVAVVVIVVIVVVIDRFELTDNFLIFVP